MSKDLEKRIAAIEARNKRVELDKAWETGALRRFILFILTCIFTYGFLRLIEEPHAFGNSIVAASGFILSTLTVSYLKNWWISRQ